ncbi:hypothetical protein H206_06962 [Candidatus Electrothrix aarhusensis]|uniref:Uncharacterized protein n=1 Tax=Candidatus Electrothrix aarhusensis TaxID=1859131 RepID=A0A444J3X3_9BACT|nr:hypothetical protein H206_06962 [Candidatus Electrothrix aarhusensis]
MCLKPSKSFSLGKAACKYLAEFFRVAILIEI